MDFDRRSLLAFGLLATLPTRALANTRYEEVKWEELMPPDWSPMKAWQAISRRLGPLGDASPEAMDAMEKLRKEWDAAPTHAKWTGKPVRIPGYVVALDANRESMREFLLVPYFGACIHSPPPPANQIVHVQSKTPLQKIRTMDAVWVEGVLAEQRLTSEIAVSGYLMDAHRVYPYKQ